MNELARFWILFLALGISVTSLAYLVVSFLFPNPQLIESGTGMRVTATILAIVSMGVFIWALMFLGPEGETEIPQG